VPDYAQGDIVFARFLDADGRACVDPHPAMILIRTDRIADTNPVWVAAISSTYSEPLRDGWKKLPWAPGGHPRTGLWKDCVLKCDWRATVEKSAIIRKLGAVSTETLEWAIEWIKADVARAKAP
jgi:mRNA-degrading endonuclease toxin of MazEF toxin-antitoxin module